MATTFTIHKLVLLHLQSVPFSFSFISQRDKERPWSMMNEEEEQETSTLSWRHTTRLSQSLQILERLGGHTDWLVSAEFFTTTKRLMRDHTIHNLSKQLKPTEHIKLTQTLTRATKNLQFQGWFFFKLNIEKTPGYKSDLLEVYGQLLYIQYNALKYPHHKNGANTSYVAMVTKTKSSYSSNKHNL